MWLQNLKANRLFIAKYYYFVLNGNAALDNYSGFIFFQIVVQNLEF